MATGVLIGALLMLAVNLRPAVTSVGAVLPDVEEALTLGPGGAGLLTALPVVCFAFAGALTPMLLRATSHRGAMTVALVLLVIGLGVRPASSNAVVFLIASSCALLGIAIANVALPGLVKSWFPGRVTQVMALLSAAIAVGTAAGAALTVPAADLAGDSWRFGLWLWAAAGLLALVPWVLLSLRLKTVENVVAGHNELVSGAQGVSPWRSMRARWLLVFWATQSTHAYILFGWLPTVLQDEGIKAGGAGLYLALMTVLGVPVSVFLSVRQRRSTSMRGLVTVLTACYAVGYLGLLLIPREGTLLWVSMLGLGSGTFAVLFTLVATRGGTQRGVDALSSFVQPLGYVISGAGPLAAGLVAGLAVDRGTHGGHAVLLLLIALLVPQAVAGWACSGPWTLDGKD